MEHPITQELTTASRQKKTPVLDGRGCSVEQNLRGDCLLLELDKQPPLKYIHNNYNTLSFACQGYFYGAG